MQRSWLKRIEGTLPTEENDIEDDLTDDDDDDDDNNSDESHSNEKHCQSQIQRDMMSLETTRTSNSSCAVKIGWNRNPCRSKTHSNTSESFMKVARMFLPVEPKKVHRQKGSRRTNTVSKTK
jgi:hypothetical protein